MPISTTPKADKTGLYLIFATLLMAICGLIYELLAGTLSSYLLGDSVTQFSLVIGWFLTSMGIGSWLSRYITKNQLAWLILIEILIGFVGGNLTLAGFITFTYTEIYQFTLLGLTGLIGIFVGLEIPLIICILKDFDDLKITVAKVMSADYIGALAASIVFPFVLVPHLGLNRAGIVTGFANLLIALFLVYRFKIKLGRFYTKLLLFTFFCLGFLGLSYFYSQGLISHMEDSLYQDRVVYSKNSKYQRIIVTRWRNDTRLYLNGHLQFSSVDEYRYHETLVHLPMHLAKGRESVLILGGGDGLAAREVLKYPEVKEVVLVDLDEEVTRVFRDNPLLAELNDSALSDPRVKIINTDAMAYLQSAQASFDVILVDLPDPGEPVLSKLYTKSFYGLAARHLRPGGKIITQSTSPFRAREAFWCIHNTMAEVQLAESTLKVKALHVLIPTFGTWGFNIAGFDDFDPSAIELTVPCRFLTNEFIPSMFDFPADMKAEKTKINTLNEPAVVEYYRNGYHRYLN